MDVSPFLWDQALSVCEKEAKKVRGVYVSIRNTWQAQVTESELVHERKRVCVGTSAHVCEFPYLWQIRQTYCTCGNVFGEMEADFTVQGEGSHMQELKSQRPDKQLPLRLFFRQRQQKSSDSNLATGLQSGNHMCSAAPAFLNVKLLSTADLCDCLCRPQLLLAAQTSLQ